jgi:hypothetical protein
MPKVVAVLGSISASSDTIIGMAEKAALKKVYRQKEVQTKKQNSLC